MTLASTSVEERRKFTRSEPPARFQINLLQSHRSVTLENVTFSEGGLCLRLQEMLEVRAVVRLQFTAARSGEVAGPLRSRRPVSCAGRVAWVVQRLDLRNEPPFLYDIGIEFVDPPPMLRQLMAQSGVGGPAGKKHSIRERSLTSWTVRGRTYLPQLERTPHQAMHWHLIVSVDGMPCFSERYPSERTALAAWERFKRQQAKR